MEFPQASAKTADWTESLISSVSPESYDSSTPCAEWNVRELLNHMIGGPMFFAAVMRRETPPDGEGIDLVGDDPTTAFRSAIDAYQATISDPASLEGTVNPPFGETPAGVFVGIALIDQIAHSWDLATATGQDATIPADLLTIADPFARQALGGFPRSPQLFAEEVAVGDDASDQDKFIAFLGRQP